MSETPRPPRAVWRRVTPPRIAPPPPRGAGLVPDFFGADLDKMPRCGGEGALSDAEYAEKLETEEAQEAERARAYRAEQEKQRKEEEAARKAEQKRRDEEDDVKAAERYRNDRYSVKLLRQEKNAWGGSDAGSGTLG